MCCIRTAQCSLPEILFRACTPYILRHSKIPLVGGWVVGTRTMPHTASVRAFCGLGSLFGMKSNRRRSCSKRVSQVGLTAIGLMTDRVVSGFSAEQFGIMITALAYESRGVSVLPLLSLPAQANVVPPRACVRYRGGEKASRDKSSARDYDSGWKTLFIFMLTRNLLRHATNFESRTTLETCVGWREIAIH